VVAGWQQISIFGKKQKKSSKKQSESAFLTNNPALFWNNLA
jgi:hypothetical protein